MNKFACDSLYLLYVTYIKYAFVLRCDKEREHSGFRKGGESLRKGETELMVLQICTSQIGLE